MILAFMGPAGSGKDTSCNYLVNQYKFKKRAFAKPLKDIVQVMFQISDQQLHVDKELPDARWNNVTHRQMLQFVGTEWIRNQLSLLIPNIGEDYFVKLFEIWYNEHWLDDIVVSDLRFKNEAEYLKSIGAVIILVQRPELEFINSHVSEHEHISIIHDYVVINDTFEHLYSQIDAIIKSLASVP